MSAAFQTRIFPSSLEDHYYVEIRFFKTLKEHFPDFNVVAFVTDAKYHLWKWLAHNDMPTIWSAAYKNTRLSITADLRPVAWCPTRKMAKIMERAFWNAWCDQYARFYIEEVESAFEEMAWLTSTST